MAGRGPAPKPTSKRARRNKEPTPLKIIESKPVDQPELPKRMPNGNPWPAITRAWWRRWKTDPLAADFTASDWSELRDTAVLHGLYWTGEYKVAAELRLRTAKFGATVEDRARLRIQYAAADEAEDKRKERRAKPETKPEYRGLRVAK